jgi:hypothetical protein
MLTVPRVDDPEFFISRPFDLSAPPQVRRTVESIFLAAADPAFPPFQVLPYLDWLGALIGLAYGWGGAGRLYGRFGAVIGAAAGYSLARAFGFLLARTLLIRLSLPHAIAHSIAAGRYSAALAQAERFWTLKMETDPARIARFRASRHLIALRDLILGQRYRAPTALLAANLLGTQGLLRETLNQPEAALVYYQRALGFCPDHPYLPYVALGLLEKHPHLEWDRAVLLESLRRIQRQRHSYARFIFIFYHDLIGRLFPEFETLPRPAVPASLDAKVETPEPREVAPVSGPPASAYPGRCFVRLIESLTEPIPTGLMVVEGEKISVVRLAGMTYQFARQLVKAAHAEVHLQHPLEQQGWVSAQELIETLTPIASGAGPETIEKHFHKLQQLLQEAGVKPELIERDRRGCYRLFADPSKIMLDPAASGRI